MATIMQALDSTIANVALPHMSGSVSATQDQIVWVLTSYIVAAAVVMPLTGWLASRFGRKQLFQSSIILFTLASALCGTATNLEQIVLYRLLQGIGGAAIMPLSQSLMLDINSTDRHGRAMAIWSMGIMVAPIMGPTLGGWITDNYSWRWIFYINVPVGIATLAGLSVFLKEPKLLRPVSLDIFGYSILAIGIVALQLLLDRGELKGWFDSTEICIEATILGLAVYLLTISTLTKTRPFLNSALLRDRNFVIASLAGMLVGFIMMGSTALLPPLFQTLLGYPVMTTGFILMPRGIAMLVSMQIVGKLIGRIDNRLILLFGLIAMSASQYEMSFLNLNMDSSVIVRASIVQGAGMGFIFVPLATIAFTTLSPSSRNDGASFFTLARSLGSSVGISVAQTFFSRSVQTMRSTYVEHIRPDNPLAQAILSVPGGL
jgi:DHA2 family multidrug resistance protein